MPAWLAPAIISGVQMGIGALQRNAARKKREKAMKEMRYETPSAVEEQVQMARERASRRTAPGTDIAIARGESNIAQTIAKGETVAESPSDVLGLYAQAMGQKQTMTERILEGGLQYQDKSQLELNRVMNLMAESQGQQFHYNRYVPFMSNMQMAGQQFAGGAANIAAGAQTAYSAWANDWMMKQMKEIYGPGDQGGPGQDPNTPSYDFGEVTGGGEMSQLFQNTRQGAAPVGPDYASWYNKTTPGANNQPWSFSNWDNSQSTPWDVKFNPNVSKPIFKNNS